MNLGLIAFTLWHIKCEMKTENKEKYCTIGFTLKNNNLSSA